MRKMALIASFILCMTALFVSVIAEGDEGQAAGTPGEDGMIVLSVAGEAYLPPFSYVDEHGKFTGFSVELIHHLSEVTGLNMTYAPMNLYEAEDALERGDIDVLMGLKYTAGREEHFDFSDSYLIVSDVIVAPKHKAGIDLLTDLKHHIVAIQDDPSTFDLLQNIRRVELNIAQNEQAALKLLMMGRADAYVGSRRTAEHYLKAWGQEHVYRVIETPIQPAEYAFAVKNGNGLLLDKLNEGLLILRANGTYDELYFKWFKRSDVLLMTRLKHSVYALAGCIAVIGVLLIMGFIWNQRLKEEVNKQTKSLQEANRALKKRKQEIANRDAFKQQILNSTPSGIVTFDTRFKPTSMNDKAKNVLGQAGKVDCHPLIRECWQKVKGGSVAYTGEATYRLAGRDYVIHYHVRPIYSTEQRHTGYLLAFENRTEEKKLLQKLTAQEKMHALGQLSAGLAHEMRNPLTSIKTFIQMLPEKYDHPGFREAIMQHVPAEIHRLDQTIEHLLDYSRPQEPKIRPFDVKKWLDAILTLFQPTLDEETIRPSVTVEDGVQIVADDQQMKQVIVNIILNAVDAMKHANEKHLAIHVRSASPAVEMTISDSGTGMEKEQIEKIYEPFFTTKADGVGLGMTISYQLVHENGGDIDVTSTPGEGTSFIIRLPAAQGEENTGEADSCHR